MIAALGTSLTARGAWLEALPSELEALIHCPVRVLNFGRVGATSRWGLEIVDQVIQAQPDIAIIEFAINDAALHRCVSIMESAASLTSMVRRLRTAPSNGRVYLMTMSPALGVRGLLRLRLARYYDLYPTIAAQECIGLIENRPDWAALPSAILHRAIPDGTHPRAEFSVSITLPNVLQAVARGLKIAPKKSSSAESTIGLSV